MLFRFTNPLHKTSHEVDSVRGPRPFQGQRARNEEILVVDDRAQVRPAEMVDNKLVRILKEASLPVSQTRLKSLILRRSAS